MKIKPNIMTLNGVTFDFTYGNLVSARSEKYPFLTVFGTSAEEAERKLYKALKEYRVGENNGIENLRN